MMSIAKLQHNYKGSSRTVSRTTLGRGGIGEDTVGGVHTMDPRRLGNSAPFSVFTLPKKGFIPGTDDDGYEQIWKEFTCSLLELFYAGNEEELDIDPKLKDSLDLDLQELLKINTNENDETNQLLLEEGDPDNLPDDQ